MLTEERKQQLVQAALEARQHVYAPYSEYPVGAALLLKDGSVLQGVNIENAAYPTTICAERVAVFKAVSEGKKDFEAIAVVSRDAGTPCGSCRQVMAEFTLDMTVLIADEQGMIHEETTVAGLLPSAFGPQNLLNKK